MGFMVLKSLNEPNLHLTLPGCIQSPSYQWMNFGESGFQPRHLISRLKTAPTILVLALSL